MVYAEEAVRRLGIINQELHRLASTLKSKSKLKLIVSETTAVGMALVAAGLWFFEDYPVETIMALYAVETVAAMTLAVLCVLILAPAREYTGETRSKSIILKDFILVCGFGTIVVLTFPAVFIFIHGGGNGITWGDVKFGLIFIGCFQLFEFFANLLLLHPLSLKVSESMLAQSFGGIALILISMLVGILLAVFFNVSVFLPFLILKVVCDLGMPVQLFLYGNQLPEPLDLGVKIKKRSMFRRAV